MKKQVLFIHGAGEGAYEADKHLAASLQHSLGPEYEVHCPAMPDEENAPYEQWKHHIDKELATMRDRSFSSAIRSELQLSLSA